MIRAHWNMKEVNEYLAKALKKTKTLRPMFMYAKVILDRSIMMNFRNQGRPKKWASLAPLTSANRAAERTGTAILQRYGTLRQSIGTEILDITDTSMYYGTKQVKAAMLHFGGVIRPKHGKYLAIPAPGVIGRPRDFEKTFIPKGKHVIMQSFRYGKKGSQMGLFGGKGAKVLFILKTFVIIPARPYMMFQSADLQAIGELAIEYIYGDKKV